MLVEVDETGYSPADLKVIGLGGAGGNAIGRMLESEIRGVDFLVTNTDIQALNASACPKRIQIGASITGGLGSGGDPQIGRKSAEEDRELIRAHLEGADMVFITAGMGGGTGTGASPVVAQVGRELGALTVGIVTRPFTFEGRRRMRQAEEGLEQLRDCVDTLIIIPNQRLLHVVDRTTPLNEALRVADDVLAHATKGISEIITVPGLINVDFADVRSVMRGMGNALMGMGFGQGPDRAREAAQMAISSPLLEDISISGAQALLVNFLGGDDMTLAEVDEASNQILQAAGEDANVIFGAVIDPRMKDEVRVTLIATGFGGAPEMSVAAGDAISEAERIFAAEIRGGAPVPIGDGMRRQDEPELEPLPIGAQEQAPDAAESPVLVGAGVSALTPKNNGAFAARRAGPRIVVPAPARGGAAETATGGGAADADPLVDDGVVGSARPISSGLEMQPVRRVRASAATAAGASTAAAEIPETVVPLVWKKNLRGGKWAPTMSSRWQRVLRRDRLDVPSFLRRRQVD